MIKFLASLLLRIKSDDACIMPGLTWIVDTQSQRDSTLVAVVGAVTGDRYGAVDCHFMLLTVLRYVQQIWRKLKRNRKARRVVSFPI